MPVDLLIVGQGLAGSLLAWYSLRRHFSVLVIDDGEFNASRVAAGLINPVSGQRLNLNPEIAALLPFAERCYRQFAVHFARTFFIPLNMLRILQTERERQYAERRLLDPRYREFLQTECDYPEPVQAPLGVVVQKQTGYLNTGLLLDSLRDYFMERGIYRQTRLDYAEITLQAGLSWRDVRPRHIVFCEGYRGGKNPWFGLLPFQPAKGEIITCVSERHTPNRILNYGNWLLPIGPETFKVGASFSPKFSDTRPNPETRRQLLTRLQAVYPDLARAEVVQHAAGVRPTTLDKQPLIGTHPHHPNLHIFNGFGAKGSLSIPWYAERFAAHLQEGVALPKQADIRRYYDQSFIDPHSA
ncbi:NAD(P)/FAD-dependent oxidoreductase [Methylomonas rhizoryzae]|uniref:NAD(P)/FAD-dependent oxidoreductase n=1 Tax=Methylomonas rhizoryzae TaxID=2608981 RepID=UPI00123298A8|nr:FAD-dependent oxidoreductase [Methylomonas rhizoryzae]